MASPFPGMDPYLEQFWRDIHASLIIYARDQLQGHLPPDLRARVEERVFVESSEGTERSTYPYIRVVERGRGKSAAPAAASRMAVAQPLIIHVHEEPVTEGYIEIIDVGSGKRVVTVIEVLSLANKLPGEGQDLYLKKRRECRAAGVSLVEIDLLRAGKRLLPFPLPALPDSFQATYQVCVRRGWEHVTAKVYPLSLRERLPAIGVPLRRTDQDVPLDLQALIDQCYRNGGYDEDINYKVEPDPPLELEEARWADELLRGQGRR